MWEHPRLLDALVRSLRCLCCLALLSLQVTASQLSLLEATMAKMERVAVWSLMSGGGSGRDVFTVRLRAGVQSHTRLRGGCLLRTQCLW